MLFLLDCVEFMPNANSGVHITELDDSSGSSVSEYPLNCQENSVEEAGITLYTLSGTPTSSSMRVIGKVKHKSMVILIDLGSTHNFVDTSLFSQLHIHVDSTQILEVKVANGEVLRTHGLCKDVSIGLQGHQFLVQLHVLPMGGCDLILGTQWLSTLGVIQWDFKLLTMCFLYGQNSVLLHGLKRAGTHIQEGVHFLKEPVKRGLILQISDSISLANNVAQVLAQVATLLKQFETVFATPVGLPPIRWHEHQIQLKEGVQAICQRPYRYPLYQKNEIEKIVKELLSVGSIRHSCNPFASPILLARKADGSWRMCIDYRALN